MYNTQPKLCDPIQMLVMTELYGYNLTAIKQINTNVELETFLNTVRHHWILAAMEVGRALEEYIAHTMKRSRLRHHAQYRTDENWQKSADFSFIDREGGTVYFNVKNSTTSENSSSEGFRDSRNVLKWARYNSKKNETYWHTFPYIPGRKKLSEDGFRNYIMSEYEL